MASRRFTFLIVVFAFIPLTGFLVAQQRPVDAQDEEAVLAAVDPMRRCENRNEQPVGRGPDEIELNQGSFGNNPAEGQYQAEMTRLLKDEIQNVRRSLEEIQRKHGELIALYPRLRYYQEIVLEDRPGHYENGVLRSIKKVIVFHYVGEGDARKLNCVVIDSFAKDVYRPEQYTRKVIRLYYPNIQSMEIQTIRQHVDMRSRLDYASASLQIEALRKIFLSLRTALYSMDMLIASYYDRRNQKNFWQIDL